MGLQQAGQATITVDLLVIGWGKGGKTLAGVLGRAGRSVALVEQSDQMYGGTCINIACVPTKTLVHQAELRQPDDDPASYFAASVTFRDTLIGKLRKRNHEMLATVDTVTLIDGHARFVGPHEVEIAGGDERLLVRAETIVINTGTVPAVPPIEGVQGNARVYDSTTLQHVDPLPERLVIVGAGFIGLEFAGMFAHYGSQVTVLNSGERLLARQDADVAAEVEEVMAGQGVVFVHGARANGVEDAGDHAVVRYDGPEGAAEIEAEAVLLATGRTPATEGLGLEAAGIETDERGFVRVDDQLRTSVPGVYAIGDVNGGPQFTYISLDDYRIVLDQLQGAGERSRADRVAVPNCTFITPPLAHVGMTEQQARESGRSVQVAAKRVAEIAAMPRPKIVKQPEGLIKFLIDADSDEILGATLFCIDSQELINMVALAMRAGVTAGQLRDGIWTHPSSTEAFNEVLGARRPLD